MTSGASAANSAAYLRRLAASPAAQRMSIRTLRPSVQPNCCSPCRNTALLACASGSSAADVMSTPMRRMRSGCCARAASGHAAAAPPSSAMKFPPPHSITSSARASSIGGMARPSFLAVLRLIASSNLVGCNTGRSAGLSPFRMRPAYTPA